MAPGGTNWINYSLRNTPAIIPEDDLTRESPARISDFYQGVRFLMILHGSDRVPLDLQQNYHRITSDGFFQVLYDAVNSGEYMATGWVDEYVQAAEEISFRMRGYPRKMRLQLRDLREAERCPSGPKIDRPRFRGFLDLPEQVRNRIYQLLLVRDAIAVTDWAVGTKMGSIRRRTDYDVRVFKDSRRTTYTVRVQGRVSWIGVGIMQVNRQIYNESAQIFYGENTFKFLGTGESTLSFLHDHARRLDTLSKVEIRFSCDNNVRFNGVYNLTCSIPTAPYTWIQCWRRIINFFVHSSTGLIDFKLSIGSAFWQEAPWETGTDFGEAADVVFNTRNLCEPHWTLPREPNPPIENGPRFIPRNFLQHIARLGGVNLYLEIDGSDTSAEKLKFSRELLKILVSLTQARPYLADDSMPQCVCNIRLLRECCIWDREGKMRRR